MSKPTLPALALSLLPLAANADELHVPAQYPTIQAAIDAAAQQGDDIFIAPGTYREHLNGLNKSLTLVGAGAAQTILSADLDNDGAPDGDILTYDNHDGDLAPFITITGITFKEANTAFTIGLAGDITIAACRFEACESAAVKAEGIPGDGPRVPPIPAYIRDLFITDTVFVDARSRVSISASMRDAAFTRCDFSRISAASISLGCDSFKVYDSSFTDNTGMVMYVSSQSSVIKNCVFESNSGGGLDINTQTGTMKDCTFEHNSGGSEYNSASIRADSFLIDSCVFNNNGLGQERHNGALGILGWAGDGVVVQDCFFRGNQGANGSAIDATQIFRIENSVFENNIGSITGPINCVGVSPSLITNCQFINNGSVDDGGNYEPGGGGGVCGEGGEVTIEDCIFRGNKAERGGAVFSPSRTWVNRCRFEANRAKSDNGGEGGAIRGHYLGVTNSTFIGNHAEGGGGGAIASVRPPVLSNNVFFDNTSSYGSVVKNIGPARGRWLQDSAARHISLSACIIIPTADTTSHFVNGTAQTPVDLTNNIFTTDPASIGFTRTPSAGGDGWGDDPTTPLIDESLNDDFGDLTLLPDSPAIDVGNNANLPIDIYDLNDNGDETDFLIGTTDLAGNPRFIDVWNIANTHTPGAFAGPIDIGPIEFQADPCPADVNHDLALTPADFTAWITAYNTNAPECDQNGNNWCNSSDFNAWIENYNAGCQ